MGHYEYRRVEYRGAEWTDLRSIGYRTIAVNSEGVALMRRARRPDYAEVMYRRQLSDVAVERSNGFVGSLEDNQ